MPNEHELAIIETEGKTMEDKAAHLLERGAGCVIVTQGEHGCYLRGQNVECHYPAADFSPVDSTGAGDAFISALASYLMYGCTVRQAVEIATYAAGYSITRKGVI
ncbi:MAG: PfkB family carbohydrate kinase, partial [Bifidobacterium breve]